MDVIWKILMAEISQAETCVCQVSDSVVGLADSLLTVVRGKLPETPPEEAEGVTKFRQQ